MLRRGFAPFLLMICHFYSVKSPYDLLAVKIIWASLFHFLFSSGPTFLLTMFAVFFMFLLGQLL